MSKALSNTVTGVLVACALVITLAVVRKEFLTPLPSTATDEPRALEGWEDLTDAGLRLGPDNATVVVIEFADFQCPFCAIEATNLRRVLSRYSKRPRRSLPPFPTPAHPPPRLFGRHRRRVCRRTGSLRSVSRRSVRSAGSDRHRRLVDLRYLGRCRYDGLRHVHERFLASQTSGRRPSDGQATWPHRNALGDHRRPPAPRDAQRRASPRAHRPSLPTQIEGLPMITTQSATAARRLASSRHPIG